MAKRTPRSEADDTVTGASAAPPKTRAPRASRGSTARRDNAPSAPEVPAARSQTFAPRPEANDQAVVDASVPAMRSESRSSQPSEEDIRMRAYQRYLERGGGHGMDFEDWLEAERELRTRR